MPPAPAAAEPPPPPPPPEDPLKPPWVDWTTLVFTPLAWLPALVRRRSVWAMGSVVAGVGDVEIVFDGQSNSILQRDVELAVAHQVLQARRVVEVDRSGAVLGVYGERGLWECGIST